MADAKPKKFIKSAIKKPGQLHKDLGIKSNKKIPVKTLEKAEKMPGKVGQRARFAATLRKISRK